MALCLDLLGDTKSHIKRNKLKIKTGKFVSPKILLLLVKVQVLKPGISMSDKHFELSWHHNFNEWLWAWYFGNISILIIATEEIDLLYLLPLDQT